MTLKRKNPVHPVAFSDTFEHLICFQEYATKLGYNGTALQAGSWGHAPFGCFIGHPADNWSYLYYNSQSGQTGKDVYRTLCNVREATATVQAGVPAVAADPGIHISAVTESLYQNKSGMLHKF